MAEPEQLTPGQRNLIGPLQMARGWSGGVGVGVCVIPMWRRVIICTCMKDVAYAQEVLSSQGSPPLGLEAMFGKVPHNMKLRALLSNPMKSLYPEIVWVVRKNMTLDSTSYEENCLCPYDSECDVHKSLEDSRRNIK